MRTGECGQPSVEHRADRLYFRRAAKGEMRDRSDDGENVLDAMLQVAEQHCIALAQALAFKRQSGEAGSPSHQCVVPAAKLDRLSKAQDEGAERSAVRSERRSRLDGLDSMLQAEATPILVETAVATNINAFKFAEQAGQQLPR